MNFINRNKVFFLIQLYFVPILLFSQYSDKFNSLKSISNNVKSSQMVYNYDLKFQRLDLIINPAIRFVEGSTTIYYKTQQQIDTLILNLSDSLKVDSVKHTQILNFNRFNNLLKIKISSTINIIDSLTIYYSGIPSDSDYFFQGPHSETNSTPIISSFSEPYGAYSWFPCKQDLTDKIDSVEIIITSPIGNKTAANGVLISETDDGISITSHWKHTHPIDYYLIGFTTTNYQINNSKIGLNNGDSISFVNYLYPESYNSELAKIVEFQNVFQFFYDFAGEYPFKNEKYGHAQWSRGGGMEHQTISFMYNLDFALVVHELSHQWFGNYITCGSWQDIWLNEGLATFYTIHIEKYFHNQFWYKPLLKDKMWHICSIDTGSVFCPDTTNVDRIFNPKLSYSKGGLVLNSLRWEIGDSAFFKAIKNYLNDPLLKNKTAKTEDIKRLFEISADTSLTEFFGDWIYGEGFPKYNFNWSQDSLNFLHLQVNQTTTHNSVSFYEMHLPIQIFGNNTDTVIRLHNTYNNQLFTLPISFKIDSIKFNENYDIITKDATAIQSINEIKSIDFFRIYPSFAKEFVNVEIKTRIAENFNLKILNINGSVIDEIVLKTNNYKINVRNYAKGLYFIQLIGNSINKIEKFEVQ